MPGELKTSKFAIVVSTAVSKKAVVRNKLRRQIRGLLYRTGAHKTQGIDCMIICKRASVEQRFAQLSGELIGGLVKARVIKALRR